KETVIIMTSNAGTGSKEIRVGYEKQDESVAQLEVLSDFFKPEFLNRFDSIVTFNELSKENLLAIVNLMLTELMTNIEYIDINIVITDEAKDKLVELGYEAKLGARQLRRVI